MISRLLAAIDRLIEPPRKPTWRPVYRLTTPGWPAPKSSITDAEAYQAIVDAYEMGLHKAEEATP